MERINVEKRTLIGKKAKGLLEAGLIPAVIYNTKNESTNIQIPLNIATKVAATAKSSSIYELSLEGKDVKAIIKEIDKDPRTERIRHLSFFEIDEDSVMTFTVPFELEGVAPAVKNSLGVLVKVLSSLDFRCTLKDLVPAIIIDISKLEKPGDTITLDDLELPKGLSLINEALSASAIVTITQLQKLEEIVEEESDEDEDEDAEEGEEGKADGETEEGEEKETEDEGEKKEAEGEEK